MIDSFDITNAVVDANGQVKIAVDDFADPNAPNDVTFTNSSTSPITLLTIEKFGGNDGEKDVIRVDLSQFDENFALVLKDSGDTIADVLILEGVHRYEDNGDGTFSVSYFGSDGQLHFVQVTPENATLDVYYAPDGVFNGTEGAETISPGDEDFQGDFIDGADGAPDSIIGYGGNDSIDAGTGNDTVFGDYDTFDGLLTPGLPDRAFIGTPPGPAGGAEIDSVTLDDTIIDNNGEATIAIDQFADPGLANDVTIVDGGTEALTLLTIVKGGGNDAEADVFRLDLSGFDDDFSIALANTDALDTLILTNVHTVDENADGTYTVGYYGADAQLHTIDSIVLGNARLEAYVTPDSPYFFSDTIAGGAGDDVIDGGFGDDSVTGGADNDRIVGGVGLDTLAGGTGNDTIYGDWEAGPTPENVPGTPDTFVDGSDWTPAAGVWDADISAVEDPAIANHILFTDNGTFVGVNEIKISGQDGDGEEDIIHFDLRTFDDDFFINFRSRSSVEDKVYLEGIYASEVDADTGIWTVSYYGADETLHTVTLNPGAASVETFFGPAPDSLFYDDHDLITGGDGDDLIDGGFGDDTIDAGADNDSVDGGLGDDAILGGGGNDTIYGGDGLDPIPLQRIGFEWSGIPDPDDGGQIDNNDPLETGVQNVNGVEVAYSFSSANATFTTSPIATAGVDGGGTAVNPNSGISFDDTVIADLAFSRPVSNLSFRVNDFENFSESMTIRAYDADGNLVPFTATEGANINGSDTDAAAGSDTFTSSGPELGDQNLDNSVLIEIAGPVARLEMDMSSTGGSLTATDIYFDDPATGVNEIGNDSIAAGDGDDVIHAGKGTDTVDGGLGTDTYDASVSPDLAGETLTVTVDANGDGTAVKSADGTTDLLTSVEAFIAAEDAAENDAISFTDAVRSIDVTGIGDDAVGVFTSSDTGMSYAFGGAGEPTVGEILAGTFDPGTGPLSPNGSYQITGGEEDGATVGGAYFENFERSSFDVICFAQDSRILTGQGEIPVQDLAPGMLVQTMDNGLQPLRWIGATRVRAEGRHAPVRFETGTLGANRPLYVSPQHRMLLTGWQAELYFGEPEILTSAKSLVNGTTIRACPGGLVTYYHMLFDRHEIVFGNGIPSESLHPAHVAMNAIGAEAREEVLSLFPELRGDRVRYGYTARPTLKTFEGNLLAQFAA